jgi:A/G-specific adenine glycosylase
VKKARRATVELREDCAWIRQNGRVLLQQQNHGTRWRGLWKLPPAPLHTASRQSGDAALFQTTYPFTHHRVTLRVFPATAPEILATDHAWHALAALDSVAVAAPHRRALRHLLALAG